MEDFDRCMNLAMRYLGLRARSEREMADYLRRKEMADDVIETVLLRLREYRYLDDAEYAEQFAQTRLNKGGARKIAYELRQKGIDADIIEQTIAQIDPDQEAETAYMYAKKALRGESDAKAKQRAWAALSRRGFSGDAVRSAIQRALDEMEIDYDGDEWD